MALTAASLAAAIGQPESLATRLLPVVNALVQEAAPSAPEAVRDEAAIRAAGWLADRPADGRRTESVGEVSAGWEVGAKGALRGSGALALLLPWREHRAGVCEPAEDGE